jgi:hypothetical protein
VRADQASSLALFSSSGGFPLITASIRLLPPFPLTRTDPIENVDNSR